MTFQKSYWNLALGLSSYGITSIGMSIMFLCAVIGLG
jgi:hypothetical protein